MSSPKRSLAALALITLVLLCNTFPTAAQTYTSAKEFLSGGSPSVVTTGDFNHDGNLDVAVANYGTTVSVLLGNADATFQAPVDYPISTALLGGIAAGDFNGDGRLDLAVTDRNGALFILFGNGDAIVDPPHRQHADRATGSVNQLDFFGQHALDAIAKNRVRMPPAHFHDLDRSLLGDINLSDETFDFSNQYPSLLAIAKLVEISHAAAPLVVAEPRSSASSVCTKSQRMW